MRKLATIRRIDNIEPIEGADRIELVTVGGWKVVVAKDVGHKIGNLVVYCEIDSFLPIKPEFEFLRKSSYKKMGDKEGFRLKTIKLRGQISQGLILPLSVFEGYSYDPAKILNIGADVSEILGIEKYEEPIPAELAGEVKGGFPSWFPKTDEERIQNLTDNWGQYSDYNYYVTEKLDGSSNTYYWVEGEFGVCSRNWDLKETEGNTRWRIARELGLPAKLEKLDVDIAIQGELIGEGIQGNPYKIKGQEFHVFNIYDVTQCKYVDKEDVETLCETLGLKVVPVVSPAEKMPETVFEILEMAEGKSLLNPETEREGLVWVANNSTNRISFKTISNKFLL